MTTRFNPGFPVGATWPGRIAVGVTAAVALLVGGVDTTQTAIANGDTRTITILHEHTKEQATITFRRNGAYEPEALKQLSWLLRDWRTDEPIRMEPRLFDIVWQVYREVGAREPIHVVSAYRSPETNAALRRRSRAVAEHSQHMLGRAMDFYLPDASMARVREVGMRIQNGGVGFYPHAFNPFVHLDAGSVRSWPRMPRQQLARLFPDGRTVHIPKDGKPMPGYEEAKTTILARGGSVAGYASYADAGDESAGPRKSLWATLFGGSDDEDSNFYASSAARGRSPGAGTRVAAYAPSGNSDDAGTRSFFTARRPAEAAPSRRGPSAGIPAAADAPPPGLESYGTPAPGPVSAPSAAAPPLIPMPPRRPGDVAFFPVSSASAPQRTQMAAASSVALPGSAGTERRDARVDPVGRTG